MSVSHAHCANGTTTQVISCTAQTQTYNISSPPCLRALTHLQQLTLRTRWCTASSPEHIPSRSKPLLALWGPTQIQSIVHSLPHPASLLPVAALTKLRSALV